jgi:hypothetical protein
MKRQKRQKGYLDVIANNAKKESKKKRKRSGVLCYRAR